MADRDTEERASSIIGILKARSDNTPISEAGRDSV